MDTLWTSRQVDASSSSVVALVVPVDFGLCGKEGADAALLAELRALGLSNGLQAMAWLSCQSSMSG